MFFLSVWRISKIVTEEEGPGMIFSRLREISGAEYDGVPEQWDLLSWHSKLLQCPYCLSVWVALLLSLLRITNRELYRITVVTFSGSAATVLIEDLNNG
jgi:hypothetical protein